MKPYVDKDPQSHVHLITPQTAHAKLIQIQQADCFDQKMLDHILYSLLVTKPIFITTISTDVILTAKFLKFFPSSKNFINFTEITFLAHVLIYCLEFDNIENVKRYRQKIDAHDIWHIKNYDSSKFSERLYEVLKSIVNKTSESEVKGVIDDVSEWYKEFLLNK